MPCGHTVLVRGITILALKSRDCAACVCSVCDAPVLQPEDCAELMVRTQRRRANDFAATAADWQSLEEELADGEQPIAVPSASLLCALAAAFSSLRAPAFIAPPQLSFLSFAETTTVFNRFFDYLRDENTVSSATPRQWYRSLQQFAHNAQARPDGPTVSGNALPPSWRVELSRWRMRTVRLLTHRGCTKNDPSHCGIHKHGGRLWCGLQRHADDQTEDQVEMAGVDEGEILLMAEITALMKGSDLEEYPGSIDDLRALAEQKRVDFDGPIGNAGTHEGFSGQRGGEGDDEDIVLLASCIGRNETCDGKR